MRDLGRQILVAALFTAVAGSAQAQLSNKPFSFSSGGGPSVGMSIGGRQAILNEQLTGATPRVLVRDGFGELVDVAPAPGGPAALARRPGEGNFLPNFSRADFRGGNPGMSVGAFNAFFVPGRDRSGGFILVQGESGALINTWTARVVSDASGVIYRFDSTVDVWTGQVGGLLPVVRR